MTGLGTILNIATVLIGAALGMLIGNRLPEKMQQTIIAALGLVTIVIGVDMALGSANILIPLGSLLVGGMLGEAVDIDAALQRLGAWLEARFVPRTSASDSPSLKSERGTGGEVEATRRFIKGFVTTSLIFCVGPMTILGSIQDGLTGNYQLLAIKSLLDGFGALAFASSLGIGVAFSALTIAIFQGSLTLLAEQASAVLTEPMITEMTAAGGVMLVGLAISALLEIKPIRVANLLPALLIAPLIVAILAALGLPIAPEF